MLKKSSWTKPSDFDTQQPSAPPTVWEQHRAPDGRVRIELVHPCTCALVHLCTRSPEDFVTSLSLLPHGLRTSRLTCDSRSFLSSCLLIFLSSCLPSARFTSTTGQPSSPSGPDPRARPLSAQAGKVRCFCGVLPVALPVHPLLTLSQWCGTRDQFDDDTLMYRPRPTLNPSLRRSFARSSGGTAGNNAKVREDCRCRCRHRRCTTGDNTFPLADDDLLVLR